MSAGSRIFIVVLVLAFLGTGLYYLVIADSEGPAPALAPLVAEPAPVPGSRIATGSPISAERGRSRSSLTATRTCRSSVRCFNAETPMR